MRGNQAAPKRPRTITQRLRSEDAQRMRHPDTETREWLSIIAHDPCAYCGRRVGRKMTYDHIIPVSKGGIWHWSNIIRVCSACNNKKRARDIISALHFIMNNDPDESQAMAEAQQRRVENVRRSAETLRHGGKLTLHFATVVAYQESGIEIPDDLFLASREAFERHKMDIWYQYGKKAYKNWRPPKAWLEKYPRRR